MARVGGFGRSSSFGISKGDNNIFQYIIIGLLIVTLLVSLSAHAKISNIKKYAVPKTLDNDFLDKMGSHDTTRAFEGKLPLRIIKISDDELTADKVGLSLLQAQISGLDDSYLGDYIVQYQDSMVVYDSKNDEVKAVLNLGQSQQETQQAQQALPGDFTQKLYSHQELNGLENEQPQGGQLDQQSLDTLKAQFPDVYQNTKAGDFLLRYSNKLIIYDYQNDKVVNSVNVN